MADHDESMSPADEAAERLAAEAFARAVDHGAVAQMSAEERELLGVIRAAAGRAAPLGELAGRGIARAALEQARRRAAMRSRRRSRWASWTAVAAAALVLVLAGGWLSRRAPAPPAALCSRSAGLLVPGPFPKGQSAAERLDRVTEDRMVALREVGYGAPAGQR